MGGGLMGNPQVSMEPTTSDPATPARDDHPQVGPLTRTVYPRGELG